MRVLSTAIIATSLALCLGAGSSEAAREDVVIEELRAKLKPSAADPTLEELEAEEGQAWLRSFTRGDRSREQFHVGVDIPLEVLGVTTLEELEAVVVEFFINDALVCTLVPEEVDMLEGIVEFAAGVRVSMRSGEAVVREIGDCGGVIPVVAGGDAAAVDLNAVELLTGNFEIKRRGKR